MNLSPEKFKKILADAGIFGPGSEELVQYENHLIRYFEREYKLLENNPVTLEELDISTNTGPIMEDTGALLDNHYDEKPEFFLSFLDKRYQAYSMAYYGDTPGLIRTSNVTLEEAQRAKFALIAERAGIEGHERIFNIGCGFGSLETYLLEQYPNLEITSITPSKVQLSSLRKRMQNPYDPLRIGKFNLIEGEFNEQILHSLKKNSFDIVISIGVMEHSLNMKEIHHLIRKLLVRKGKSFHHFITSIQPIPQFLNPRKTRIGLYFPGGRVWPPEAFTRHAEDFELDMHWFINGLNYWRTLVEWHQRFWEKLPELYGPVFDADAIAHWNNYFSLCKAVFAPQDGQFYGNSHYLLRMIN